MTRGLVTPKPAAETRSAGNYGFLHLLTYGFSDPMAGWAISMAKTRPLKLVSELFSHRHVRSLGRDRCSVVTRQISLRD